MKFCFLSWLKIFLSWHDSWTNTSDCCSAGVLIVNGYLMTSNPNLISSIHDHQNPLILSPNWSFLKRKFPGLLSKSNHLTNSILSSEEVLVTFLPYFSHRSPSISPTPPSKLLLLLSPGSCRNTGDLIGALGHLVGRLAVACFEVELWKKHLGR